MEILVATQTLLILTQTHMPNQIQKVDALPVKYCHFGLHFRQDVCCESNLKNLSKMVLYQKFILHDLTLFFAA